VHGAEANVLRGELTGGGARRDLVGLGDTVGVAALLTATAVTVGPRRYSAWQAGAVQ